MSKPVTPQNAVVHTKPRAYLTESVDTTTGEIVYFSKYKYLEGAPKQYRFNAQNGQFNINGDQILMDSKGKTIESFSLQPIAWRIFEENLFGRGRKEKWAEIFFIDEKNCVSGIMVNNTTLEELSKLSESLFYDDLTLADVVLNIKPEKIENERDGQKRSWYIGRFSYELANPATVAELRQFAQDFNIYRRDTLTSTAVYWVKSDTFRIPEVEGHEIPQIEARNEERLLPQPMHPHDGA